MARCFAACTTMQARPSGPSTSVDGGRAGGGRAPAGRASDGAGAVGLEIEGPDRPLGEVAEDVALLPGAPAAAARRDQATRDGGVATVVIVAVLGGQAVAGGSRLLAVAQAPERAGELH